MNTDTVGISIIAAEARDSVAKAATVNDKLRAAMKVAHRHWMVTDPDQQLRGALAAVLLDCAPDDKERLTKEVRALSALSAGTSGLPIDFAALDLPEKPIGVLKLWHETTGAPEKP